MMMIFIFHLVEGSQGSEAYLPGPSNIADSVFRDVQYNGLTRQ